MIGRAVWWLVCRVFGAHSVTEEMLDGLDAVIAEEAALLGLSAPAATLGRDVPVDRR